MQHWGFARNVTRVNVMRKEVKWVWSDTLGLLRDRCGNIHTTKSSKAYPEVIEVINRWLSDRLPAEVKQFGWTSLNVNKDYAAKIHRDGNNFGPSMIAAFGDFSGGSLNYFPEDDGKMDLEKLESSSKREKFDLKNGLALFNGNSAHCVDDFEGHRYSIVYFTLGCHSKMKPEERDLLQSMKFAVPKEDADPFTHLRPPRGYSSKAAYKGTRAVATPLRQNMPASRYWKKASLAAAKKRKA